MLAQPPAPPAPRTFTHLIVAFTSFLTVAIHTILHQRSLYPRTSFLTARAYNYPVHQSRHPAVCAWVADAVAAVEAELLQNRAARVALVVYSVASRPLERFVWDVSRFPAVAKEERETTFAEREGEGPRPVDAEPTDANVDLEEQFRASLAKLTACGGLLRPLPPGCTFTVAVELREDADAPIGHAQPWIPAHPSLQATKQKGDSEKLARGEELGGAKMTPVRAVRAGEMMFEMWIEEGKAKVDTDGSASNNSSANYR